MKLNTDSRKIIRKYAKRAGMSYQDALKEWSEVAESSKYTNRQIIKIIQGVFNEIDYGGVFGGLIKADIMDKERGKNAFGGLFSDTRKLRPRIASFIYRRNPNLKWKDLRNLSLKKLDQLFKETISEEDFSTSDEYIFGMNEDGSIELNTTNSDIEYPLENYQGTASSRQQEYVIIQYQKDIHGNIIKKVATTVWRYLSGNNASSIASFGKYEESYPGYVNDEIIIAIFNMKD